MVSDLETDRKELSLEELRLGFAKLFLGDEILPRVRDYEGLDQKLIETLIDEFRGRHQQEVGCDFGLPHVWIQASRYLARAQEAAQKGIITHELGLAQRTVDILTKIEKARAEKLPELQ